MKKLFLVGVILVLFSGFVSGDTGDVGDCVVTNAASCPNGYSVFLWLSDETNAHASRVEYQEDYGYKLCCDNRLAGTGTVPLRLYDNSNSHVVSSDVLKGTVSAFEFSDLYDCELYDSSIVLDGTFCVLRMTGVYNAHAESCTLSNSAYGTSLACFLTGTGSEYPCSSFADGTAVCDSAPCGEGFENITFPANDCNEPNFCHICVEGPVDPGGDCSDDPDAECVDDQDCEGVEVCDPDTCECGVPPEEPDEPGSCEGTYTLGGDCLICEGNGDGVECGAFDGYFEQTIYHYGLSINDCGGHGLLACLDDESFCLWTDTSYGYCFLNVDEDVPFFDYFSVVFALVLISSYYLYDRKRKDL